MTRKTYQQVTQEMLKRIEDMYRKNGGGLFAIRDIFGDVKTVTQAIEKMEAHARASAEKRANRGAVLGVMDLFTGPPEQSASEKTLNQLQRMQVITPPSVPGEHGTIERVDMIARWRKWDSQQMQPESSEMPGEAPTPKR